jgi:7-cyano-7-deazaguanine synthase
MKTHEHFATTYEEAGFEQAVLTTLPDMFVLGQAVQIETWQRLCRNHHNTDVAVSRASAIAPALGEAWQRHMEQDRYTHNFAYEPYQHKRVEQPPEDSVMLLSGGLDSFATWRLLGQPKAVYFAIGHRAQDKELAAVGKIRERFDGDITIDRSLQLGQHEMDNGYIPYRNLYFLMAASTYSPDIVLSQIAEWAPDKNPTFYRHASKLLKSITTGKFQGLEPQKVKVHTPFGKWTKSQLIHKYGQEFDAQELTDFSTSCYSDSEIACGTCNACVSRAIAMENNGIHEPHLEEPDPSILTSKLDIRDYRIGRTKMLLKRWFEMRGAI